MHVDDILKQIVFEEQSNGQRVSKPLEIPADWTQGRTVFGGISAGLLYQAMCGMLSEDYKIFNYSVNFVGPLSADSPFCIVIQPLRKGKNVTHIRADIVQNTQTCVSTLACFGLPRTSFVKVSSHQKSASIKNAQPVLQTTNNPAFFQHFDLEIEHGDMPFSGSSSATYLGFMRFAKRPTAIGYAHLITMIDAWPPAVLQMLQQPAPASTVTWNLSFPQTVEGLNNSDWFRYDVNTQQAAHGYAHTEAIVLNSNNEVVAVSRQTIAVFD